MSLMIKIGTVITVATMAACGGGATSTRAPIIHVPITKPPTVIASSDYITTCELRLEQHPIGDLIALGPGITTVLGVPSDLAVAATDLCVGVWKQMDNYALPTFVMPSQATLIYDEQMAYLGWRQGTFGNGARVGPDPTPPTYPW
jgi:hypothetical protein